MVAPPIPIQSEMERKIEKAGTAILTPAKPLGPTPCPTKMPSTTILIDISSMPRTEGIKYEMKSFLIGVSRNFTLVSVMINKLLLLYG